MYIFKLTWLDLTYGVNATPRTHRRRTKINKLFVRAPRRGQVKPVDGHVKQEKVERTYVCCSRCPYTRTLYSIETNEQQ